MRLRNIVRWRTKKRRWRSTSLICRDSRPTICTLGTSLPRNRSARIRASTLSVLICASAMMRVLKGLAGLNAFGG